MKLLLKLRRELKEIADSKRARASLRYFKTGKGEYGEGDVFLGITVPQSRKIANKFKNLSLSEITKLLKSKIHEERLIALLILIHKFDARDNTNILENIRMRKKVYDFYLNNTKYINNWDLVDSSAHKIVGGYLSRGVLSKVIPPAHLRQDYGGQASTSAALPLEASKRSGVGSPSSFATPLILFKLARSENLWERRIAVISTFQFIKYNQFNNSLKIAEILLKDPHDLIHKAVGWMLREIGKRDLQTEIKFLNKHYQKMPRTMLRYAIEKLPEKLREIYLA